MGGLVEVVDRVLGGCWVFVTKGALGRFYIGMGFLWWGGCLRMSDVPRLLYS